MLQFFVKSIALLLVMLGSVVRSTGISRTSVHRSSVNSYSFGVLVNRWLHGCLLYIVFVVRVYVNLCFTSATGCLCRSLCTELNDLLVMAFI